MAKGGGGNQMPQHRLGVMGGDHPAGEGDVGEVLAEGMEVGVGRIGDAGERIAAVSGWRRQVPAPPPARIGR
jgi:hypothetical protein